MLAKDWHSWGVSAGADRVRALVSGLPGDRSRHKPFMVLQAFIDDSSDGSRQKVFCLGGYIATAEAWASFSKEWEEAVKGWRLPAYKFVRQDRTTHTEIDANFYRIIEKHDIPLSVDVVIDICAWNKAVESIPWRRRNGEISALERLARNPYFIASKFLMRGLFTGSHQLGFKESIDLVFDEQIFEKIILLDGWDNFKKTASPDMRKMIGALPKFEKDEDFPPLQAADLIVGHVRQYEESGNSTIGRDPFPWKAEKPIQRIAVKPTAQDLQHEVEWITSVENFERLKDSSPQLFS